MQNTNDDFTQRAVVHGARQQWVPSPAAGVERIPLDRIGAEVARATSMVKYAPGSSFREHTHTGGEEYLVLEGTFSDEYGHFPKGTYVRNPIGTKHAPFTEGGCTILVKLWQFDREDQEQLRVDEAQRVLAGGEGDGVQRFDLFRHPKGREYVRIERWAPGAAIETPPLQGLEVFVLEGSFEDGEQGERFERHSWLRLPKGQALVATAGPDGAEVWLKSGHLAEPPRGPTACT